MAEAKKAPAAKKAAKKIYWKNPHSIDGEIVRGELLPAHKKYFEDKAKETGSGAKLADWTQDFDQDALDLAERKRKMKAQIGIVE